jgi:hypothetical protein
MTEDQLEQEVLGWLSEVGYATLYGIDIAPDGNSPERSDYRSRSSAPGEAGTRYKGLPQIFTPVMAREPESHGR